MKGIFDGVALGTLAVVTVFVIVFNTIKIILSKGKKRTWRKIFIDFFVSAPVGILSGMVASEWGFGTWTCTVVAVFGVLLAENIVMAIMESRTELGRWLRTAVDNLIEKFTK